MRLGLVSAKGSPGVTTLAVCLAAVTGGIVIEADPAGGDVECWAGPQGEPGLIGLAGVLRHAPDVEGLLDQNAVDVWPGVRAIVGPIGAEQAESTLTAVGQRLAPLLSSHDGWVLVDAGRWSRGQSTGSRLSGCDAVIAVLAPTLASVGHTRPMVTALQATLGTPVVAVVVGDRGYPPTEISAALGVPVVTSVPWDRRWAEGLSSSGASRFWLRSPLARSARSLVDRLPSYLVGALAHG